MTGFGDARFQDDRLAVSVEVRTVNNRYLKVSTRCPEAYSALEGDIERCVREYIARGTVNVSVRMDRKASEDDYRLNSVALRGYWSQLHAAAGEMHAPMPPDLAALLVLPGVVQDNEFRTVNLEQDGAVIQRLLRQSLVKLQAFREEEGRSMHRELQANTTNIRERLDEVVVSAPQVVSEYRAKLLERVTALLSGSEVRVAGNDLIREVSIYADKADINEEITRLRCHLEQFQAFLDETAPAGRKLDFLSQEIFREVNTIGSKANNVAIAHAVVEMKAAVEKIREILQNVE